MSSLEPIQVIGNEIYYDRVLVGYLKEDAIHSKLDDFKSCLEEIEVTQYYKDRVEDLEAEVQELLYNKSRAEDLEDECAALEEEIKDLEKELRNKEG